MSLKTHALEFVKRHPLWTIFGVMATLITAGVLIARASQTAEDLRTQALRNYQRRYFPQARADIERALRLNPDDEASLLIAACIALEESEFDLARDLYARIETPRILDYHVMYANACIRLHHHEMGEEALIAVLERRADHAQALACLLRLYRTSYREWEHRVRLINAPPEYPPQQVDTKGLLAIPNPNGEEETGALSQVRNVHDADRVVRLAACINHIRYNDFEVARDALVEFTSEFPDMNEGHARLGLVLVRLDDLEGLREWFSRLPDPALEHPDVCFAIGVMLEKQSQPDDAQAFFRHVLAIDYRHREAISHLGELLTDSNAEAATELAELGEVQDEVQQFLANPLLGEGEQGASVEWGELVLTRLERLGWLPEAKLFCGLFSSSEGAGDIMSRLEFIEIQLAEPPNESGERDWPAIRTILRPLDPPESIDEIWRYERQAVHAEE